ncbi:hypothetical protein E5288_WYG016033 [Bos mutus]|uniref:Uncharacterized protein n=1 Tax=Bos mutus TaxID=72004 RepID=A0A6B0RRG4_9CETA|nr:hypothetical protein [Bos mutus]
MLVDSKNLGCLGVVTQEMQTEKEDKLRTLPGWAVAVSPADPLCICVLQASRTEANPTCPVPSPAPLPTDFLWGLAPGRLGWTGGI